MDALRLTDLQALRTVVDAGSLTRAAERLGCSQPAVSRRLQRIERALGARLLDRDRDGVRLTPAGEEALGYVTQTLDGLSDLRARLDGEQAGNGGAVHVVASTTPGEHLLPALVSRFLADRPDVRALVSVTDSAAVPRDLVARRADFGVSGLPSDDPRLTTVAFARDEVVLAVPAGHRLAGSGEIDAAALQGERLIGREAGSGTQETFLRALQAAERPVPDLVPISLGSTQAVLSAVAAGMGVGVVSLLAVQDHRDRRLRVVRVAGVRMDRSLWLLYETARRRTAVQAAFLAYLLRAADP